MVWYQRWGSKYGNKKQEFNGILYHSKKEAGFAADLELRKKAGDIVRWERQVPIPIRVKGYLICTYYVDFLLHYPDKTKEYVEVKGFETEVWRLKWKLFEALYSKKKNVKLTVVK